MARRRRAARLTTSHRARSARVEALALALAAFLGAGCGAGRPADTPIVFLADGRAGRQPWRLEGQRRGGKPCVSLFVEGLDRPVSARCGIQRTPLRHLDPVTVTVASRLLVFSALEAQARRVRLDQPNGSIRMEPARSAPGFPSRFFLVDLDPDDPPLAVRAFGDGGRAVVG